MKITIARALKLKNRVQAQIRQIASDFSGHNSILKFSDPDVDVKEAHAKYDQLVNYLIQLKATIFRANLPVYEQILRLAETKAKIGVVRGLDTRHGKVADRYAMSNDLLEYEATYRKAEVDDMVRALEQQVDALQDELDNHNHTTYIEIESLDL